MRTTRALTAALAAVLVLGLVPASSGAHDARAAKPERVITVTFSAPVGADVATFKGKAYKLKRKKVFLQKKVGKDEWKRVDTDRTTRYGRFVLRVKVPRNGKKHVYRVKTRADATYRTSYSQKQVLSYS